MSYTDDTADRINHSETTDDYGNLLLYFNGRVCDNGLVKRITEEVLKARINESWRGDFMTFEEHLKIAAELAREEGKAEAMVTFAVNLIRNTDLTDAEISLNTGLCEKEVAEKRRLLSKEN